jgi:hypothetical protein
MGWMLCKSFRGMGKSTFRARFFYKLASPKKFRGAAKFCRRPKELTKHHMRCRTLQNLQQRVSKASPLTNLNTLKRSKGLTRCWATFQLGAECPESVNKTFPTLVQFMCLVMTEGDKQQK